MDQQLYYNIVRANEDSEYIYHIYISSNQESLDTKCGWKVGRKVLGSEIRRCVWGRDAISLDVPTKLQDLGMVRARTLKFDNERSI